MFDAARGGRPKRQYGPHSGPIIALALDCKLRVLFVLSTRDDDDDDEGEEEDPAPAGFGFDFCLTLLDADTFAPLCKPTWMCKWGNSAAPGSAPRMRISAYGHLAVDTVQRRVFVKENGEGIRVFAYDRAGAKASMSQVGVWTIEPCAHGLICDESLSCLYWRECSVAGRLVVYDTRTLQPCEQRYVPSAQDDAEKAKRKAARKRTRFDPEGGGPIVDE